MVGSFIPRLLCHIFRLHPSIILIYIARPLAKYFGLRRPAKVNRFGEQTYALLYFAVFGAWGYVRPSLLFHALLNVH
jgi:hypothetical protein